MAAGLVGKEKYEVTRNQAWWKVMAAYPGYMTHVACRLTAKNRDQLRDPTLGNRVWASFSFFNWKSTQDAVFACAGQPSMKLPWRRIIQCSTEDAAMTPPSPTPEHTSTIQCP